jgi:hypothetical protein
MKVLAWALSIFLGLFSVAIITDSIVGGLLMLLGAALICPPLWDLFRERSGFEFRKSAAAALTIAGIVAGAIAYSNTPEGRAAAAVRLAEQKKADDVDADRSVQLAAVEETAVNKKEAEPAGLTGPQMNAVRSAEQYLGMTGFSRDGLIQQLSSDAGDGYSVLDATAAVDSLSVDWNQNAAKSARQYLSISGFSCKGLIEQLSSGAGDKYTVEQATYGAHQAGAC